MKSTTRGNMGLRIIVFMGIGTFLFLALIAFGLKRSIAPQEHTRVPPGTARSPFDASRAWTDLEFLVSLGPRPSGSPAMEQQQQFISRHLRAAGLEVRQFPFDTASPRGAIPMNNILGVVPGSRPGVIILSGHYDTLYQPEGAGVGANDGAANAAWLLEMARVLGPRREGRSVWILFLDGEETQTRDNPSDGGYGSQRIVDVLRERNELATVDAVINVDRIADCYLTLRRNADAPPWLAEIVWNTAARQNYETHFITATGSNERGHGSFRNADLPVLHLQDNVYGGTPLKHGQDWHTADDTVDNVCEGSFRAVGDVIYHALPVIDGRLDAIGISPDGH